MSQTGYHFESGSALPFNSPDEITNRRMSQNTSGLIAFRENLKNTVR